jgi:hypothetical protein
MKTFKKISNPLTIIAIFAGLAEINGTVVLGLVPEDLQIVFIWFIILFPTFLVLIFFSILNWNPKVLYAPSDFMKDENFLANIQGKKYEAIKLDIKKEDSQQSSKFDEFVNKTNTAISKELKEAKAVRIVTYAQKTFKRVEQSMQEFFDKEQLKSFSIEAHSPGYYIFNFDMDPKKMTPRIGGLTESIIVQFRENMLGDIEIEAIGKNINETDYIEFGYQMNKFIRDTIESNRNH